MKKYILFLIITFFSFNLLPIYAQDNAAYTQQQEEIDYSYGKIVSINQDKIEISEYDYDKNEEVKVNYVIASDVELRNLNSSKDLLVGDNIEIDYIVKDNQKIIKVITLEQDGDEDLDNP